MKGKRTILLESLSEQLGDQLSVRRRSLSSILSESYKALYNCEPGTNLYILAESHLEDVRNHPKDIDRLSRHLSVLNELGRMVESKELKDEDLVDKDDIDTVEPKEERALGESTHDEDVSEEDDEDLLEDTDLTDEEVEELTKHLEEIRKKKTQEGCKASPEDLKESSGGYRVYQLIMDVAFPAEVASTLKGSIPSGAEIYNAISRALAENGLEMAGDMLDIDADVTDVYVDNEYEFFTDCNDPKKSPVDEARDFEFDQDLWAVVKDDGTFAGVPCITEEEAYQLAANHEGSSVFRLSVIADESPVKEAKNTGAILAKLGDIIVDTKTGKEGKVERVGQSGNYSLIYVNFGNGLRKINPMDDAQTTGRYQLKEKDPVKEAKTYESLSLSEFSQKSTSKAFMKTFKRLQSKLKEGKALTRQESISLYKATNSAMTHLSVELEHNPEFLSTFNEAISLLSADASKVLGSLKEGKGPSKATMKSLAKFSEAILHEDEELDIEDEEEELVDETPETEADQMSQEYALAREEILNDMIEKHGESEDPEVQETLEQESEEVHDIMVDAGLADEEDSSAGEEAEVSEEEVEESSKNSANGSVEDYYNKMKSAKNKSEVEKIVRSAKGNPNADKAYKKWSEESVEEKKDESDLDLGDDEITDDELAELKKHLKEMRQARRK